MRIGVVVHGAEVIDSGMTVRVLDRLEREVEVAATLGGAMGTAAVIDAGLEGRISIVPRQLISHALRDLDGRCDATVILNWSKSRESGLGLGAMVFERAAGSTCMPLMQLDHDFFVEWRPSVPEVLAQVASELHLERVDPPPAELLPYGVRRLHGVVPGESIWINGNVIGRATSSDVTVMLREGRLAFENVQVKEHGLQKVKVDDLSKAVVRSGSVRRTRSKLRATQQTTGERLVLVDHRAEDSIFRAKGAKAAVTVGDDTTRVSRSLLARLGVPVIGIIDGDEDGICIDDAAAPGSATIRLAPGNDDQLGELVRRMVFGGGLEIDHPGDLGELVERIARMAGDALIDVRKD